MSDLNSWSYQSGYFGWYNTGANVPNSQAYGNGMQLSLPQDNRFGAQIVIPTFDNQIYYRRNTAGSWDSWAKIWSSNNFDPDEYLDRSVPNIRSSGTANSFINGYTFAYATSGAPWNGSLISYGGFGGDYDTQFSSDYGPDGGKHISFRTRMGDFGYWNSWYELYHSGNINNSTADFTAATLRCSNVYTNGNIWAKEIKVASNNPYPDYVFKSNYKLASLKQVEIYINARHHLPEIPTETQAKKQGVDLEKMNTLLLKKVEELTLYLIEQNKINQKQETQMQAMRAELKNLTGSLNKIQVK